MFKKVFYNTFAQILGKVATAATTLLVTILIGRTLGPAGFGEFTKIFVFVGYFYTICDFGLNAIYIKRSRLTEKKTALFASLIGLRLLLGIGLAFTAILISQVLPYNAQTETGFSPLVKIGILIAAATIITQALFASANAYFQKNLRYDLATIAAVLQALVILAGAAIVSGIGAGLLGYVASYVFGGFTLIVIAYFLIAQKIGRVPRPAFDLAKLRYFMASSWPIGLALVFNLIYFRLDVVILSATRQSFEVGFYGLAYQFFEASLAVPIFLANAIYPTLVLRAGQSLAKFRREISRWLVIAVLVSLALMVFLFLISLTIPYIWGQNFAPSAVPVRILALGLPFFFISALLWYLVILGGRQKYLVLVYGLGALFNLTANLIFIPIYGYLAAAVTTVVSEGLVLLLLILVLRLPPSFKRLPALKLET